MALLLIAAVPGLADAECAPRTEKLCVLVNSPGPIIQGTILKAANSAGYEWVVRVDRSFRGNLKGQIVVWVTYGDLSGPSRNLKPGEQYLFYLQSSLADGSPGFSASACTPMNAASRREKWSRTKRLRLHPPHSATLVVTPSFSVRQ